MSDDAQLTLEAPPATEQAPASAPAQPDVKSTPPAKPLNDAFAELDRLVEVEPPAKPKPTEKKPDKPSDKSQPKQPEKPEGKPAEKPAEPAKEKASEEPPKAEGKGGHVASLREAYETSKKRIADLEQQLTKPREDPEKKELATKYETATKRLQQLEQELRDSAFERTDDYKREFEAPIVDAYKQAYADVADIEIELEDGTTKKLTNADFNSILNMPTGLAIKEVNKLGPAAASTLIAHRSNILTLLNRRNQALEVARKKYLERQDQEKQLTEKQQAEMVTRWKTLNDEAKSKYPQFFGPEEGDDEGNAILNKGYEIADMMFSGHRLTPEETVNLHAAIRNKAGAFDRMVHRNKKLSSRIKELEEELADFRKSEPSEGGAKREEQVKPKTWEDELDELVER